MVIGISTLGQSLDQISRLKTQQEQLADLQAQISSGKKAQSLSDLGNNIVSTMRARTGINSLDTYVTNITNADRRLTLMQNAIKQIKDQTSNVLGGLNLAVQQGDYPDLASIKELATNVYNFVVDAMNQQDGNRYLFGGSDTSEPPMTDSGLYDSFLGEFVPDETDISNPPLSASGVIGSWGDGTLTTDQFIDAYHAVSDTVQGFSNALTSGTAGKTTVQVNDSSSFDYTTLANKTTMKQILMVLGVIKNLPSVDQAPGALNDPTATSIATDTPPNPPAAKQANYFKVINDLASTLSKAVDGLDQQSYNLSEVQAQIGLIKDSHTTQIAAYKDIVGDNENADITEASALILQMQTQLQASFQVTSLVANLTLVNFLR